MKCIWKTKRKFDIRVVGPNLFIVEFEDLDDLESILEGRPWLFRKQVVNFERFLKLLCRRRYSWLRLLFDLRSALAP